MTLRFPLAVACALLLVPAPAPSCSLCPGSQQAPTLRQEALQPTARLILVGTLENARLLPGGNGTTELHITDVVRKDDFLAGRKVIDLPRYQPADPKNPPQYLVFCDIFKDKIDPYRGVPVKNADSVDYLKKAIALDPKDRVGSLIFFFRYLEHADAEVARDAFLEFAKASDQEIGQAAPKLSPEKLRGWLRDPKTPLERLSVYAMLLGACGTAADADLLHGLLRDGSERTVFAWDGILAGYIRLKPTAGWQVAQETLRDGKKPLQLRLAVIRTLRFFHGWQPKESRDNILQAMRSLLQQGELADVAVEDLRRWQLWDLTAEVLDLHGKKGYDAPIMQRALVRYALCCKDKPETRRFVDERRKEDAELVKEVEESLEYEKPK